MTATLLAEWVKLGRSRFFFGTLAAVVSVAALGAILTMLSVGRSDYDGVVVTATTMSRPDGVMQGLEAVSILLGVVGLAVTAAVIGADYTHGTLRNQLMAQPYRLRLLLGKCLALVAFVAVMIAAATVVAVAASFAIAPVRGVDTSAWHSVAGLAEIGKGYVNVLASSLGYATLGLLVGVVFRSPAAAVSVGLAYALPLEMLVSRIWSPAASWLPARLMDAMAAGARGYQVGYETAGIRILVFCAAAIAITLVLFARRDVTS
ncbi:ABC transporter permease subunit [Candidatus Protofrankia californiensis]|uniref:ABC transporter permease subunit n=1 Tax=Candidatus Protofrankia californiensis TaxID=1839754 RepID=UPI001041726A|nr:ABC transporter permease subunit [Candidatus Protofrankia californiensis]